MAGNPFSGYRKWNNDPHKLVFLQADLRSPRFHHFHLRSVPLTSKIVTIPYQFRTKMKFHSIIVDIKLSGIPAKALFVKEWSTVLISNTNHDNLLQLIELSTRNLNSYCKMSLMVYISEGIFNKEDLQHNGTFQHVLF